MKLPPEKAEEIISHLMEYTPDYLVSDNEKAYELCKIHALIVAQNIKAHSVNKSYWQDVCEHLAGIVDPLMFPVTP